MATIGSNYQNHLEIDSYDFVNPVGYQQKMQVLTEAARTGIRKLWEEPFNKK